MIFVLRIVPETWNVMAILTPTWKEIGESFLSRTSPEERSQLTKNLDCSNISENISTLYHFLLEKHLVPEYKNRAGKSLEASNDCRNRGNVAFKTKRDTDALKLYTESIALAPIGSQEQALAYANRSAVLFHLDKFTSALVDVNRALKMNYPEELMPKLLVRKEKCTVKINSVEAEKEFMVGSFAYLHCYIILLFPIS